MKVAGNDCCFLDRETQRTVGSPMHIMLNIYDIDLLDSLDASRV